MGRSTGDVRQRRRRSLLAVLLPVLLAAAGCTGVPSSGPAQDVRPVDQPNGPAAPSTVVQPGLPPDSIVRDFVTHATDTSQDARAANSLAIARQYLTQEAARSWNPDASKVVVLRNDFRVEIAANSTVVLKGTEVATLGEDRAYHAVPGTAYEQTIQLVKVAGQWRISNPPAELLVGETDFRNSYFERVIYFLNSTGTVLVPDPRYVTTGPTPANRADRLVRMLLAGPSSSLAAAAGSVTSQLGADAQLRSAVTIDGNLVRVDLSGVDVSGPNAKAALAAQLAWTLVSEGDVAITINGEPLDPQIPSYSTTNTASYSPDRTPGTGNLPLDPYYVDTAGRIISLGRDPGKAIWGRLGTSGTVVSAAMSAANGTLAAVSRTTAGQELLMGKPLQFQNAEPVLAADTLTTPTFDRAGNEVWVVQDGATKPQVIRLTTSSPVTRQVVDAPGLAGKGAVTALVLSPDGVRVAVVADQKLYVGVISTQKADQGDQPTVSITELTEIDPQLSDVGPVAFRSAAQLVVGAKVGSSSSGFRLLYLPSIDGGTRSSVSDDGIVGDVDAVAVGVNGVMLTAFDGRVYQLDGSVGSGEWVSPDPRSAVLAGSAPFIPS
jgi:hypothetical protein